MSPPGRAAKIPSPCTIGGLLELLTRPWTLHILWVLRISARVLTERLRTLEGAGFVFRHYEQTIPPAVTYGITDRMKDIEKVLAQLEELSRKWHGHGTTVGADRETTATGADA
jgi:DNA-binding HxlR family transcriptional regulator